MASTHSCCAGVMSINSTPINHKIPLFRRHRTRPVNLTSGLPGKKRHTRLPAGENDITSRRTPPMLTSAQNSIFAGDGTSGPEHPTRDSSGDLTCRRRSGECVLFTLFPPDRGLNRLTTKGCPLPESEKRPVAIARIGIKKPSTGFRNLSRAIMALASPPLIIEFPRTNGLCQHEFSKFRPGRPHQRPAGPRTARPDHPVDRSLPGRGCGGESMRSVR